MTYSSSLADHRSPLILDTSVLINLHASTHGQRIVSVLPNAIFVSNVVMGELENETSRNSGDQQFAQGLLSQGMASLVNLTDAESEAYEALVSGSSSLDDGEAATIAIASSRDFTPVIDERRGRARAKIQCSATVIGWSLDLFLHPKVWAALGIEVVDALYLALRDGRMRLHEDHCEHVVSLIGIDRAIQCTCLPGYRVRREHWDAIAADRAREVLPTER